MEHDLAHASVNVISNLSRACCGRDASRPAPPGTKPHGRVSRIRLPPWMNGVKAFAWVRMQYARCRNPAGQDAAPTAPAEFTFCGHGPTSAIGSWRRRRNSILISKGDGLRLSLAAPFSVHGCEPPNSINRVFSAVQFQAELRQPLPKFSQEPLGVYAAFEAYHQIVGVPDHDPAHPHGKY